MTGAVRWIVVALIAVLLVLLLAYARGDNHHHGDDVGALARVSLTAAEA